MAELPLFGTNVDKSKVPPIHQKRIVNAFVNSFIVKTATFLETFATECEEKLLKFEVKLRQVDTQLKLIEAKLESIPVSEQLIQQPLKINDGSGDSVQQSEAAVVEEPIKSQDTVETPTQDPIVPEAVSVAEPTGVKAKDDYRYKKYFKMIHFGVPAPAIKMKLQAEGMDPDILDYPDKILPDGVIEPVAVTSDTDTDSD